MALLLVRLSRSTQAETEAREEEKPSWYLEY